MPCILDYAFSPPLNRTLTGLGVNPPRSGEIDYQATVIALTLSSNIARVISNHLNSSNLKCGNCIPD